MTKCSTGGPVPAGDVVTADNAIIILDGLYHWACTRMNREASGSRGYMVKITHGGRRVTGSARSFVGAVNRALQNLRPGDAPRLRLVGASAATGSSRVLPATPVPCGTE